MFDGIIQDFDRIKKRQKLCKKNINESINGVINCLQESIAKIKDPGAIDDVSTHSKSNTK
jgi:hypothetical protein